ncbi:MAG: cytochrome c, partial [Verrucomicrobiales bacterium]
EVGPGETALTARLASAAGNADFSIKLSGEGASLKKEGEDTLLSIAPSDKSTLITLLYTNKKDAAAPAPKALSPLKKGGEGISPESFAVQGKKGEEKTAWQVDQIPVPDIELKAPYFGKLRTSDFDFFSDGDRALVSTWDGDIWLLSGLNDFEEITWKRYATGFFEPLGLKIVNDVPYVAGRDAIWKLHDLNGDNEVDHFEIFNNDILITNNFHEFQFGLETDREGNFYVAKASPVLAGGRGFDKILPHNGAFMRISSDGYKLDVLATGLRAPGGIGIGPEGQITTGENEGTWQPCCKINYWEPKNGIGFFGTEDARHQATEEFTKPLCYLPMDVDNSGGSQLWVPENAEIGLKTGELLHLSYGQSAVYRVLPQKVSDGFYQGGVAKLPVKLSSSAQRAAIHPADGSLYVCGFRGWQTNAAKNEGIQRIRYVDDRDILIANGLEVTEKGIKISFEVELDAELAEDPASYQIERWKYIRSKQYGSGHFSIDNPDEAAEKAATEKESKGHRVHDKVEVTKATLLDDKKSVLIEIKDLKPAEQMRIDYDLESADGEVMIDTIHNTVHQVLN